MPKSDRLLGDNTSGAISNFGESSISRTILTASGGITGFLPSTWKIDVAGFANAEQGTFSLALTNSDKDLSLVYTPIPEPSAYAVLAGFMSLGGALVYRRRRTAK
jgi:hypothetical protein